MAKLTLADNEDALARVAAERITTLIDDSIEARGSAIVCLTGGSTPRRLYTLLADGSHPWRDRIDWSRLHLFWGDERHVPPDHRDSNFGMAASVMLDRVSVPSPQVHRMRGELADATDAARDYDRELRAGFAAAGRSDTTFDLMLLGLGEDAHIASLFPGSELLREPVTNGPAVTGADANVSPGRAVVARQTEDRATAVWAPHLNAWRITLTPRALLDARAIVMLVAGEKKAAAVHAGIEGGLDVSRWPAQLLRQAGDRVEWMLDVAAAAKLPTGRRDTSPHT